jgi:hypothetical protein
MPCYAACLGNCSTKLSKEHYLPKGIWKNPIITFDGFDWTGDSPKNLPVKNVAQKILCTKHNSEHSPLDEAAKRLFNTAEHFHINQHKRSSMSRSSIWKPDSAEFDGHTLERLLAKIAVGVMQERSTQRWHITNSPAIEVPKSIVETIYGLREFTPPMGMYLVNAVGDKLFNQDHVSIQTMFHPETNGYIGSIISLRDWQFFINLSQLDLKDYWMESASGVIIGRNGSAPTYRIARINFTTKGKLSGKLTIKW